MKALDSMPLLILGALGVAIYYASRPKAPTYFGPGGMVPVADPKTSQAAALIGQVVTAAVTAISKPVATTQTSGAPLLNAPAYSPPAWAPPQF